MGLFIASHRLKLLLVLSNISADIRIELQFQMTEFSVSKTDLSHSSGTTTRQVQTESYAHYSCRIYPSFSPIVTA